jgi:polysaccharide chain length determinant protein (PEP-CTERM system associated)
VLVEQPASVSDKSILPQDLQQRLSSIQEQILSRSRLEPMINSLGLYPKERGQASMDDLVARLAKTIVVSPVKPMAETPTTTLPGFTVKVSAGNAALAQRICNEVLSLFMRENLHFREVRAQDTTTFLTSQLTDAKGKLDDQDAKLAAFKSHYIGALPEDEQANLSLLAGLNTQLDASTQALSRASQDKAFTESMLAQQTAALEASQAGQSPDSLQKQLADQQAQLAALQAKYTEDYPDVMKVKGTVADLKSRIAAAGNQDTSVSRAPTANRNTVDTPEVAQLRGQVHQYDLLIKEKTAQQKELQKQIATYQGRIQLSPNVEEQYKLITRDYQTALDFYNDLLKKRSQSAMEANLQQQQQSAQLRILDAPNLPDSPSFPNRLYFALGGLVLGLLAGAGATYSIEAHDKTLRTEQDVEFFLQTPTLASVPFVDMPQNGHHHAPNTPIIPSLVART